MRYYGTFTIVRLIILVIIYLLLVLSPGFFGIVVPGELQSLYPAVVSIIIPSLYLIFFNRLGGYFVTEVNIAKPIEKILADVTSDVRICGRRKEIERLLAKNALGDIQVCLCGQASGYSIEGCHARFAKIRTEGQNYGAAQGASQSAIDKSIMEEFVAWFEKKLEGIPGTKKKTYADILRGC